MSVTAIAIGLVLAFIAWRLVTGLAKFAILAVIVVALLYYLSQGGLG